MATLKFQYDSDVTAITNALQVAATQYDRDAQAFEGEQTERVLGSEGNKSMARQFRDQAATARRLVREIDEQT